MKKGLREKFFWLVGVYVCEVYGCKPGDLAVIQWDINYGRYWFSRISFTVQEEDGGLPCIQSEFWDENYPREHFVT